MHPVFVDTLYCFIKLSKTKMDPIIPPDNCYVALLSMAEGFRCQAPPDIQSSLQCLMAILNLPTHPRIVAKTHLQIGNLIMQHTLNLDIAHKYIEEAVNNHINSFK